MQWLAQALHKYPELAVFLAVGLGYWIGAAKYKGFGLGATTGSLVVAGVPRGASQAVRRSTMSNDDQGQRILTVWYLENALRG